MLESLLVLVCHLKKENLVSGFPGRRCLVFFFLSILSFVFLAFYFTPEKIGVGEKGECGRKYSDVAEAVLWSSMLIANHHTRGKNRQEKEKDRDCYSMYQ